VLDASVTLKWFASEPGSADARSLVHSDEELVAPVLAQVEVASALVKKATRQQLSLEGAHEALTLWFEAINDGDIVLLPDADTSPRRRSWRCNWGTLWPIARIWHWPSTWAWRRSQPIGPSFVARNGAPHWFSSSRRRGAEAALTPAGGWGRSSAPPRAAPPARSRG
jgi:hypothetical protein